MKTIPKKQAGQVYFDIGEYAIIKQEAERQNISVAEYIRRATKEYLERHRVGVKKTFDELPQVHWAKPPPKDMAKNVDRYLYGEK